MKHTTTTEKSSSRMDNNFVAMAKCFACGNDAHILIHTRFRNIQEAHNKVDPHHPFCQQCADMMKAGNTILLSVRDGEKGENPYRTGRMCVMTPQGTARLFKGPPPTLAFVEDTMWANLGLPNQDDDHSDPRAATEGWIAATCEKCGTMRGVRPEWRTAKQHSIIQARCRTCQPEQTDDSYELFPHKIDLYISHVRKKEEPADAPPQAPEGGSGTPGVSDQAPARPEVVDQGNDPKVGSGDGGLQPAQ